MARNLRRGRLKQVFPRVRIGEVRFFLYCVKDRQADPNIVAFAEFAKSLRLSGMAG